MTLQTSVEYRYFLTDLLSNTVIAEVPFKGVSFERANKKAGGFSGSIPFIPDTKALDLYNATMPGRTGLYVLRNGVCVWGGMIWGRQYSVSDKNLSVDAAEFTSYFYHRHIWQTIVYGSGYIGVSSYSVSNGTATVTVEEPHGFSEGQKVKITTVSPLVDGQQTITEIPSATQIRFDTTSANGSGSSTAGALRLLADTFDVARDLVYRIASDLGGLAFANDAIRPGKDFDVSIISKQRSLNVATLTTSQPHDLIPGQEIDVLEVGVGFDGNFFVTEIPTPTTFKYYSPGVDVAPSALSGIRTLNVTAKEMLNGYATLTLDAPHGATLGQTILVSGVDGFFTGILDTTFNGRFTITEIPASNKIKFFTGAILDQAPTAVSGGLAALGSKIIYGDFGSYLANSDLGFEFESEDQSGVYRDTLTLRGFEQKSVGEILEEFSNSTNGPFDYRIDCDYDFDTATFTRTFRLFGINPEDKPALGETFNPSDFGADQLVFEYPGNILTFTVDESAEEAATRFFVVGRISDLTDEASQPYSGAASPIFLNNPNGYSWPLLDQVEQLEQEIPEYKAQDEDTLWNYATDYLYESLPPIGTYSIQVSGSISPIVGSYFPGDWCTLIIDDEFVRQRLANDQEPRDDILMRRISSYKVNVPDAPTFPETVDLTLVTDWKARKRG
jgi:hypothetical protein